MNDMTPAAIGHNGPPDPIDEINASFEADREEASNWTDGAPVENEAQMKAVDALRKSMRAPALRIFLQRRASWGGCSGRDRAPFGNNRLSRNPAGSGSGSSHTEQWTRGGT